jgi:hypothetical protein
MKNLKNESRSIEREFMWIEFGSRWSVDWDIEYLSIDGIERLYKEGVDELLEDEYGKEIVEEFCELKSDYERNIFSVILSDDREELYIEVNEKNKDLVELFNKDEEEGIYRIGEEVDSLFGVKSWSEIIKEYKVFENM